MKKIFSLVLAVVLILGAVPVSFAAEKLSAPEIRLTCISSTGKIKVSWTKVDGADRYEVYRADSRKGEYKLLKTKTALSFVNTGAENGKTYFYKVRAIAKDGTEGEFSTVKYRTCDLARPEVATSLSTKGYPKLVWKAVENATAYEVYRTTDKFGTYKLIKTTEKTSFINTSAKNGKKYYYYVKAVCGKSAADSCESYIAAIKTNKEPLPLVKSVTLKNGELYTFGFYDNVPFTVGNLCIESVKLKAVYDNWGSGYYYPKIILTAEKTDGKDYKYRVNVYNSEGYSVKCFTTEDGSLSFIDDGAGKLTAELNFSPFNGHKLNEAGLYTVKIEEIK